MTSETYAFDDWHGGKNPPKGWDVSDALRDGWTIQNIDTWMRAMVRPWTPPAPLANPASARDHEDTGSRREPSSAAVEGRTVEQAEPDPATVPPAEPPATMRASKSVADTSRAKTVDHISGADGVSRISPFRVVEHGSEVEIAHILARLLPPVCGGKVVRADSKFWAFGPTAWQEIPDIELRRAVHKFDGAGVGPHGRPLKVGKRMIDGIISELGTILGEPGFFDTPTVAVNALNGVVSVEPDGKVVVRPHDPEDKFRFTIEAEFHLHTDMTPPEGSMLRRLVHGAFKDDPDAADKLHLVSEILGAAAFGLATRLPQPKAFVFLGETASNWIGR